jgi:glutamyl-tRNA synthetase
MTTTRTTADGYVGRYAPSPTGDLHLGNVFAAVCAAARARKRHGRLLLRIEDIDTPRTVPEAAAHIALDLDVLGFTFDAGPHFDDGRGPYVQSQARTRYDDALLRLRESGVLYACRCSRKDLRDASAPHGDEGPIYAGTCRALGLPFDDPDLPVAWRVRAEAGSIVVDDALAGTCAQDVAREVGDFIVRRKDGLYAYQLAVVVDDAHQGVTEVVRGRDLLSSTPRQIMLQRALALPTPDYAHIPLLVDESGARLAKRRGDETVRSHLARGISPTAILGALGHALGCADADEELTLADLLARIDDVQLARATITWRERF